MTLLFDPSAPRPAVTIDGKKCRRCGLCARVCPGPIRMEDGEPRFDPGRHVGCIECGQCAAVCPPGAVEVRGRDLGPEDMAPLPARKDRPSYARLRNLLDARRSVRSFKERAVSRPAVGRILDAAAAAPMGVPPSGVEVLVLHGREKVRAFRDDVLDVMIAQKWIFHPLAGLLLRPFLGREMVRILRTFVRPVVEGYAEGREKGVDRFLYDAPLALYFHASRYTDEADPVIAATYAMLAAEAQGLGTCFIGTVAPFLHRSAALREKYGIPPRHRPGIALVAGHPAVRYRRTLRRRLGRVHHWQPGEPS